MKRLKNKLLAMEPNTATYQEMYEGLMMVTDPYYPDMLPACINDPVYFDDQIGYEITRTHKLAQDKPTVKIAIPWDSLGGVDVPVYARCAVADFALRQLGGYLEVLNTQLNNRSRPDNENGKYYVHKPGGEILLRNTAFFEVCSQCDYEYAGGSCVRLVPKEQRISSKLCLCFRIQVQLPKRQIRKVVQMLCRDLPEVVNRFAANFDAQSLQKVMELAEKQAAIREFLKNSEYCAFVANGSILPRAKGGDLPMPKAVPFQASPDDEIEICGVRGMGIKRGVTVITGGGYSGKSTLLDAIAKGIYDHVFGDGRELCVTDDRAVSISAEDGRCVSRVNISPFIQWLPRGDTMDFSTDCASGSTSQAANIMEAVHDGAKLLLIDEDRSATNFMIRDEKMKILIKNEPIMPLTARVRELFESLGVSTILVIGGSGEYLSVADRIYIMEDYYISDVTERAKGISNATQDEPKVRADWSQHRTLSNQGFTSYPADSGSERLTVSELGYMMIGDERIDVRGLHDIVSSCQLDALGFMLRYLEISYRGAKVDVLRRADELYKLIDREGLDVVYSGYFTTCARFLDLPRKQELLALVNRMRKTKYHKDGG